MTEENIHKICEYYSIKNYKINSDMTIDVNGDVNLSDCELTIIPLKFNKVNGNFYVNFNELTDFFNAPTYVAGTCACVRNNLTSLYGFPLYVGYNFNCAGNNLTTLNDLPMNFYVGGEFYCANNNITSPIEFGRLFFGTIVGEITTGYDNLDKFLNKYKNPPKKDLPKILSELRKIYF